MPQAPSSVSSTFARRVIASFICIVLVLQMAPILLKVGWRIYPFVGYGMYSRVHVENEPLAVEYSVFVQLKSGKEVRVAAEDLGMNFWKLQWFAEAVLDGNKDQAEFMMSLYESRFGDPVAALRIESYPAIITRNGVQAVPPETLALISRNDA